MGIEALSDDDLLALKGGDLSKVSDAGLMALKQPAASVAAPKPLNLPGTIGMTEGAFGLASGAIAAPVAGLAGLAAAAIPGLPEGVGANVVNKVSDALTYRPRSPVGQATADAVSAPFNWLAGKADQAGAATAEKTGSPLLGTAVNTAIQAAPMVSMKAGGKLLGESADSVAARGKMKSLNSIRDATLKAGQDAGYVVPPTTFDPSFINKRMEGVAGKAAIAQESQVRNQTVTNKLAREELGLPDNQPISVGALEKYRNVQAEPYREVAALDPLPTKQVTANPNTRFPIRYSGTPPITPADALAKLKQARFDANEQWRYYDRSGEPKARIAAEEAGKTASQMELALEKTAEQAGRPDLIQQLQQARQNIAKSYDIERALNDANGNVDARIIGRAFDSGKKLSGNLELIGRFATAFKPYVREGSMVPTPGVSKLEGVASAMLGIGGHAAGLGWLPAGLPLLSGPVRGRLLSPANQVAPTYGPSLFNRAMGGSDAAAMAAIAAQGLTAEQRAALLNPQQR